MHPDNLTLKRLAILSTKGDITDLIEFFSSLPFSGSIRIGLKRFKVPMTMPELREQITWGQRLFFAQDTDDYFDGLTRIFCGWFYPVINGREFDSVKCLTIARKELNCNVDELLPFISHMTRLIEELLVDEGKLTGGKVDKTWMAAGGERLNKYGDKVTLDFLVPKLSIMYGRQMGHESVMESSYLDCLVQLMERKEFAEVEEEYRELTMLNTKSK